jgi:hypothetical protein
MSAELGDEPLGQIGPVGQLGLGEIRGESQGFDFLTQFQFQVSILSLCV